jgi:hypothetical protein
MEIRCECLVHLCDWREMILEVLLCFRIFWGNGEGHSPGWSLVLSRESLHGKCRLVVVHCPSMCKVLGSIPSTALFPPQQQQKNPYRWGGPAFTEFLPKGEHTQVLRSLVRAIWPCCGSFSLLNKAISIDHWPKPTCLFYQESILAKALGISIYHSYKLI